MQKSSIGKFLISVVSFIVATAISQYYNIDTAQVNFALAMGLVLLFNPFMLKREGLYCAGLCALILELLTFIISAKIWSVWLFLGFMIFVWSVTEKELKTNECFLILVAGFFNLSIITNTAHTDIQYDFASCYNYIEYILENNFLFWRENPLLTRPSYSTYHPILHFFLAAGVIRGVQIFTTNTAMAAEAAQVLFLSYMVWYYFLAARILKLFNLKTNTYLALLAFVVFFPTYNAICGFFNNDCLLLPLQAGAIYYALLYYENGARRNLWYSALFIVGACLTKLSGILVLPMIGVMFLLRLWQKKDKKTFNELILWGVGVSIGASIWSVYQHFVLGVGAYFVPPQEHLSLSSYSLWERFNPVDAFVYEKMFYNDFGINLWETMTKTALFGQWDFSRRGSDIFGIIIALVFVYKAILALVIVSLLIILFKKKQNIYGVFGILLVGSLLLGQVIFGIMHPYMCNQDFRYVALLPLAMAILLGVAFDNASSVIRRCVLSVLAGFAGLSAFVWWWVVSLGG